MSYLKTIARHQDLRFFPLFLTLLPSSHLPHGFLTIPAPPLLLMRLRLGLCSLGLIISIWFPPPTSPETLVLSEAAYSQQNLTALLDLTLSAPLETTDPHGCRYSALSVAPIGGALACVSIQRDKAPPSPPFIIILGATAAPPRYLAPLETEPFFGSSLPSSPTANYCYPIMTTCAPWTRSISYYLPADSRGPLDYLAAPGSWLISDGFHACGLGLHPAVMTLQSRSTLPVAFRKDSIWVATSFDDPATLTHADGSTTQNIYPWIHNPPSASADATTIWQSFPVSSFYPARVRYPSVFRFPLPSRLQPSRTHATPSRLRPCHAVFSNNSHH
jgi:hypothetical protein